MNRTEQDRALPFGWWGHRSSPEQRLTIVDLLQEGNLDARVAAFLWMAVEARASLVVASTIEDAGKTTMLTALLDFLPAEVETIYLRGWYERFDFLDSRDPGTTYLLCNEISNNLPTYLWGNGVLRLFESAQRGFSLATTIHVDTASEMIDALASFPLEVPRRLLANIDFVVSLSGGSRSSKYLRRLMRVEVLKLDGDDVAVETISERDVLLSPLVSRTGRMIGVLTERFGIDRDYATSEFARREQFLEQLQRSEAKNDGRVREALRDFATR
ncbi:MAG: hypothetical protein WBW04_10010 [Nitrolancea sp.]